MVKKKIKKKKEALTTSRMIHEILVGQLSIPLYQIVNDKAFSKYTMLDRPDLLISNVEYDIDKDNEDEYIKNLVAYAEVKDNCKVNDNEWKNAYNQAIKKSKSLNMPYFIVTNCNVVYFYNAHNGNEIELNGNPIREFQDLDILNLILNELRKDKNLINISTEGD